jgi:hypothetical protein
MPSAHHQPAINLNDLNGASPANAAGRAGDNDYLFRKSFGIHFFSPVLADG